MSKTAICSRSRFLLPLAITALAGALLFTLGVVQASAQSLTPSRASLDLQNRQARAHDFTYLRNATEVKRFVRAGWLVEVPRNGRDYTLHDISFPYARPEVKLFIERLSWQFRAGCGRKLVVTSLTRPKSRQPSNASSRSVHPTGMAVDLRRAYDEAECRDWLDRVLLSLENEGVLEVAVERRPPHYHLALFPNQYAAYVDRLTGNAGSGTRVAEARVVDYEVRRADTLWEIAASYGTTPDVIRTNNGLSSDTIYPGQVLEVPRGAGR